MGKLSRKLRVMIQTGYWPGFIVGMYPSVFAYKPVTVDFQKVWKDTREVNLYYHIPFCKFKCTYCTFFSIVKNNTEYFDQYIDKINEQFDFYNNCFGKRIRIKSICFGGGTPNHLPVEQYEKIFGTLVKANVIFDEELEPSMEVSPELITEEYLDGLATVGVKRLSLGVQSLKEDLRQSINRERNLNVLSIIEKIRDKNFNINIDVINGLPGQDVQSFMDTLKEIVKFAPETISIYPLSGEDNSLFKRSSDLMTSKDKYALFDIFYEFLLANGYRCESHIKFVKCNQTSTHQQKIYEYNGVETLGLGCGARSYNSYVHYATFGSCRGQQAIDEFIHKDFAELPWIGYNMMLDDQKRRFMIYGFFLGELDIQAYFDKFHSSVHEDFAEEIEALLDNKLVETDNLKIVLTKKGRKYTDLIGTLFWSEAVNELFTSRDGLIL